MSTSDTDGIDISSTSFWQLPMRERDRTFGRLRGEPTITRQPPIQVGLPGEGADFWAAVTNADIVAVSRQPEVFCSGRGVGFADIPPEYNEALGSFLMTDAPRHTHLRRLVSRAFTPRQIALIDEQVKEQARTLVAATVAQETGDLVDALSAPMPLWTISEMLGVPDERRRELRDAANTMVKAQDPRFLEGDDSFGQVLGAGITLSLLGSELAAERRAQPQDDLLTALVQAEVEGQQLDDQEIGAFIVLLGVAGNDTTRNSISHAVLAFAENPDQWARLRSNPDELLDTAVDEIVRWASPVQTFRRTATRATHLGGRDIAEGDHVIMFYGSGNRDDAAFEDPWRFDVARTPNPHVGFGGGGPHFCLGANMARSQLRAVFGELARTVESFEVLDAGLIGGAFVNGIDRLDVRITPAIVGAG